MPVILPPAPTLRTIEGVPVQSKLGAFRESNLHVREPAIATIFSLPTYGVVEKRLSGEGQFLERYIGQEGMIPTSFNRLGYPFLRVFGAAAGYVVDPPPLISDSRFRTPDGVPNTWADDFRNRPGDEAQLETSKGGYLMDNRAWGLGQGDRDPLYIQGAITSPPFGTPSQAGFTFEFILLLSLLPGAVDIKGVTISVGGDTDILVSKTPFIVQAFDGVSPSFEWVPYNDDHSSWVDAANSPTWAPADNIGLPGQLTRFGALTRGRPDSTDPITYPTQYFRLVYLLFFRTHNRITKRDPVIQVATSSQGAVISDGFVIFETKF